MAKNKVNKESAPKSTVSSNPWAALLGFADANGMHVELPTEKEEHDNGPLGIRAPYNFIPFSERVIARYEKIEDIPGHDRLHPALLTGEITLRVEAMTPILMYSAEDNSCDFYRNGHGEYAIPGSSLRGLIRENMQILGYGVAAPDRDIESHQLSHRVPISATSWKTKRVNFTHKVTDGIPAAYSQEVLDYPSALLGFIGNGESFRSRICVDDIIAQPGARTTPTIDLALMGPKPAFCAGYVAPRKNGKTEGPGSYDDDQFQLRGYKQYWLKAKNENRDSTTVTFTKGKGAKKNESIATIRTPVDAGAVFRGTVRYSNLHPDELGLLLWCIQLEPDCFQSLGTGKPLGYGRVKITIEKLQEYQTENLYAAFAFDNAKSIADESRIIELIAAYKRYAEEKLRAPGSKQFCFEKQSRIQDFFYMKRQVWIQPDQVSYMELDEFLEFKDLGVPLPTVSEMRKK